MPTYNFAIFFLLARMSTRKKVHAFVRVRPTDDFAHEVIRYGDDNKVSAMRLPLPAGPLCATSLQCDPVSKHHFKDPDRSGKNSDGL